MGWTILRPHHFMQNLLAQAEYIIKDGVVYSASGDGKIPYIDPRDIAAVAFVTLTQPGHLGKKYVLTGGEAISYRQAAEIIGATIGKPVRFVDESPDQARARRVREGLPPAVIESALAISAYQRAGGKTVTITNTIADLTGRPPRTVGEFVREHAAAFRLLSATRVRALRRRCSIPRSRGIYPATCAIDGRSSGRRRLCVVLSLMPWRHFKLLC